jgi:hypothetical protein
MKYYLAKIFRSDGDCLPFYKLVQAETLGEAELKLERFIDRLNRHGDDYNGHIVEDIE